MAPEWNNSSTVCSSVQIVKDSVQYRSIWMEN